MAQSLPPAPKRARTCNPGAAAVDLTVESDDESSDSLDTDEETAVLLAPSTKGKGKGKGNVKGKGKGKGRELSAGVVDLSGGDDGAGGGGSGSGSQADAKQGARAGVAFRDDASKLSALGFETRDAQAALHRAGGCVERAAELLFQRGQDGTSAQASVEGACHNVSMDAEIAQQLQAQFHHEHRQSDASFAPTSPDLRRRRGRRYWGGRVVLNGLVDPVGCDIPNPKIGPPVRCGIRTGISHGQQKDSAGVGQHGNGTSLGQQTVSGDSPRVRARAQRDGS